MCFLLSIEVERLYEESHRWKTKAEFYEAENIDRVHYNEQVSELS